MRAKASALCAVLFAGSLALYVACSSSSSNVVVTNDAGNSSDSSNPNVDTGPPSLCPAPSLTVTFASLIDSITQTMGNVAGADSGALLVPSDSDRDTFASQVMTALTFDQTAACPLPASYKVFTMKDGTDDLRVVAELDWTGKPIPVNFWGTYAARRTGTGTRALVVEAPHPLFDSNTESESAAVFSSARADYFLLAGTHRCANTNASGCDGTTNACGTVAPYREADAAHSTKTPFYAVHAAISNAGTSPILQLHGNAESCPDALVSDGSGSYADAGLAAALANAIQNGGPSVGRCGLDFPNDAGCDLCGTDDVEARETAGSSEACTMQGTTYARFVHVEQQLGLRQKSDGGPNSGDQPLLNAVNATFTPR